MAVELKVKRLLPDARLPVYGTDWAGCFDLFVADGAEPRPHPRDDQADIYRTGLAFEIPGGHVMLIFSRSGHGFKDSLRLSNCVGVIDSDYTGEVMVSLRFDSANGIRRIEPGERIAQAMVIPLPFATFTEVDELAQTRRGSGGFGSTGR